MAIGQFDAWGSTQLTTSLKQVTVGGMETLHWRGVKTLQTLWSQNRIQYKKMTRCTTR